MPLFLTPPTADRAPARHGESHFSYLARTGRASFASVRELIETWLAEIPQYHRDELTSRLRSTEDHHFEAAFFELYLHALFRRLGFRAFPHPRAGGKGRRPDFLMESPTTRFLLEAATVAESSAAGRGEEARRNMVLDALNEVDCPDYFFHVRHYGELASPPSVRALKEEVRRFLAALNYDDVRAAATEQGLTAMPSMRFRHGDFRLAVSVIPVSPEKRGDPDHRPLGMLGPGEAQWIDDRTPIRDKLRAKASHYGRIRRPLIVAINAAGRQVDQTDIMEALFGKEGYVVQWDSSGRRRKPKFQRHPDGAWWGPQGPRHRTVSAMLVVSSLLPWTVAVHRPVLYHNPWARYPVSLPSTLTQFAPEGDHMVERAGMPINEILGLPQDWPRGLPDD